MAFSFGGFKSTSAATTTTSSTPSIFSFGTKTTTAATTSVASTTPLFSSSSPFSFGVSTSKPSTGLFGTTTPATQTAPAATTPAAAPQLSEDEVVVKSLTLPQVFGDERDTTILKWNQLQILYGTGTIYCGPNVQTKVNEKNQYAAFKAFTYGAKPVESEDDSCVVLILNKKAEQVASERQTIIDLLQKMFGSNANVSVQIQGLKPIYADRSELIFRVVEKQPVFMLDRGPFATAERKIPAVDVIRFIEKTVQQPATTTTSTFSFSTTSSSSSSSVNWKSECEKVGLVDIFPEKPWTNKDIELYVNCPPDGIPASLWTQANNENPDRENLIPIPIIGFSGVRDRLNTQRIESQVQAQQMNKLAEEVDLMQRNVAILQNRHAELDRCLRSCSHRMLKVILKLNLKMKAGTILTPADEALYVRVNALLNRVLNAADGPKSRLLATKNKLLPNAASEAPLSLANTKEIGEALAILQSHIQNLFERTVASAPNL